MKREYSRLDNLLAEINMTQFIFDSHINVPKGENVWIYRQCRKDIIDRYNLAKGEYTKYYAMNRGRINKNETR